MNLTALALVSPRFFRRTPDAEKAASNFTVIKVGDAVVVKEAEAGSVQQKACMYLQVVKTDGRRSARFYSDSDRTFHFGSLCLDKCQVSLSSQDVRMIHVKREDSDDPSNGICLRAKSEQDAVELAAALSNDNT